MNPETGTIEGVEIIILTWHTCALLRDCLASLYRHAPSQVPDGFALQVTVVDNASGDNTVNMVRTEFPQTALLQNDKNLGFAAGMNRAMALSRMKYVLLLNSDTLILENTLAPLLDFMEQHPRAGICGPRLLNKDGSLQSSCRDFPDPFSDFLDKIELYRWPRLYSLILPGRVAQSDHNHLRPVDWLMGACLLVRREAFVQTGLLDQDYFFYSEETDWCYRFKQAGWQTWFVPQAELTHLWGQSSKLLPYRRIIWLYQSKIRFYRKHYPYQRLVLFRLGDWAAFIPRLLALLLLLPVSGPARRRHRRDTIKAYWRVLWLPLRD